MFRNHKQWVFLILIYIFVLIVFFIFFSQVHKFKRRILDVIPHFLSPISNQDKQSGTATKGNNSQGDGITVQGNQLFSSNTPIVLRGGQIESEFNENWKGGAKISSVMNPTVFAAMRAWNMNAVRIPVAAYYYQQQNYMNLLDTAVLQANQAGLYVILANFEDPMAGGGNSVLDQQGMQFWKFISQHYGNNYKVLFDLINEPQYQNWSEWRNGGSGAIGLQQVITTLRSSEDKHVIVAEWLDKGKDSSAGFANIGNNFIQDKNIIYSEHIYFKDTLERSSTGWDSEFGNLSQTYPILIGEWALLPNARHQNFCQGLDASSGMQLTESFLSYMQKHTINWIAWSFTVPHLIQDETTFTPTNLDGQWCCGQGPVCVAGMGSLIKAFLINGQVPNTNSASSPIPKARHHKKNGL